MELWRCVEWEWGMGHPCLPPQGGGLSWSVPLPLTPLPVTSLISAGFGMGSPAGVHPVISFCPSLLSPPAATFPRTVGVSKYPWPGSGSPTLCFCPIRALTLVSEPGPQPPVEAQWPGSLVWDSLASLSPGAKSSRQHGGGGGKAGELVFPPQLGLEPTHSHWPLLCARLLTQELLS